MRRWLALASVVGWTLMQASVPSQSELFHRALAKERTEGDLPGAIALYEEVADDESVERALRAEALLRLGRCYELLDDPAALHAYERIRDEFADVTEVAGLARQRLATAAARGPAPRGPATTLVFSYDDHTLTPGWTDAVRPTPYDYSPDGRRLVFVADFGDEPGQLYVSDHRGTVVRPLLDREHVEGRFFRSPRWSPDGRTIAYIGAREVDGELRASVWVVSVEGGAPRDLLSEKWPRSAPNNGWIIQGVEWRPDGSGLTMARRGGLAAIDLEGNVSSFRQMPLHYTFMLGGHSPDGRWVSFAVRNRDRESPEERDVWLLPTEGQGAARQITHADGLDAYPTFGSGGTMLYFVSERGGTPNVWRVTLDPASGQRVSEPEQVTFYDDAGLSRLRSIGDGERMAFVLTNARSGIHILDDTRSDAARTIVDGTAPLLSPDGDIVYFRGEGPGRSGIFVVSASGGDPRRLTSHVPATAFGRGFELSPDGRTLALFVRDGERAVLIALPVDGGEAKRLAVVESAEGGETSNLVPSWAPDGLSLAYAVDSDLFVVSASEGEPVRIAQLWSWDEWTVRWSPDGEYIAALGWEAADQRNAVFVVPAAGGEPRRITQPEDDGYKWQLQWHPDSKRLTYADEFTGQVRQAFLDGRPSEVMVAQDGVYFYEGRWSPDGIRYFVRGAERAWELYVYDEQTREVMPASYPVQGGTLTALPSFSRGGAKMAWATSEIAVQLWTMSVDR